MTLVPLLAAVCQSCLLASGYEVYRASQDRDALVACLQQSPDASSCAAQRAAYESDMQMADQLNPSHTTVRVEQSP